MNRSLFLTGAALLLCTTARAQTEVEVFPASTIHHVDGVYRMSSGEIEMESGQTHLVTPIVIYNNPGTTHFSFTDALIGRLARLETVKAVKNPAPEPALAEAAVAGLRAQVPADFSIGFSGDWNTPDALLAGGQAWYSVLAGTFPTPCLQIRDAAARGDAEEVRRLNTRLANAAFHPDWLRWRREAI